MLSVFRPKAVPLPQVRRLFLHQIQLWAPPAEETRRDPTDAATQRRPRQKRRGRRIARERRSETKNASTFKYLFLKKDKDIKVTLVWGIFSLSELLIRSDV